MVRSADSRLIDIQSDRWKNRDKNDRGLSRELFKKWRASKTDKEGKPLSCKQVAEQLNAHLPFKKQLDEDKINGWERHGVNPYYVDDLAAVMGRSGAQIIAFARLSALDPEWLSHYPADKQAGLLLASYREKNTDLGMDDIASELGLRNRFSLHNWEIGRAQISGDKFPSLKKLLKLRDKEYQTLLLARYPILNPTIEIPPLKNDPKQQHEYRWELFDCLLDRAGMETKILNQRLALSKNRMASWRSGVKNITEESGHALMEAVDEMTAQLAKTDPIFSALFKDAYQRVEQAFHSVKAMTAHSIHAAPIRTGRLRGKPLVELLQQTPGGAARD